MSHQNVANLEECVKICKETATCSFFTICVYSSAVVCTPTSFFESDLTATNCKYAPIKC